MPTNHILNLPSNLPRRPRSLIPSPLSIRMNARAPMLLHLRCVILIIAVDFAVARDQGVGVGVDVLPDGFGGFANAGEGAFGVFGCVLAAGAVGAVTGGTGVSFGGRWVGCGEGGCGGGVWGWCVGHFEYAWLWLKGVLW